MSENEDTTQLSYDEVPYLSFPYPASHPDALATIATLFGMGPAPAERCRVLEIGCASGGNLLPMACCYPESKFLGIDLSSRHIDEAQEAVNELELQNVDVRQMDMMDITDQMGSFDYIIAHGVYSWIPEQVQEKMLSIFRTNLSQQGIAYVSYNVYPGWHMREQIRDMMLYHIEPFKNPHEKIRQARALLQFMANVAPSQNRNFANLLMAELNILNRQNDSYLYHEHLEKHNQPIYFHQLMKRAEATELQYLGESPLSSMMTFDLAPRVQRALAQVGNDMVRREQYMDFVRNRMFRQTLLVHKEAYIRRDLQDVPLEPFRFASSAKPEWEGFVPTDREVVRFRAGNRVVTASDPLMKCALLELADAWPQSVPFDELFERAGNRMGGGDPEFTEMDRLGKELLQLCTGGHLQMAIAPSVAVSPSEKPRACPFARRQAAQNNRFVTNARHNHIELDEVSLQLVQLCDGSRDHAALVEGMTEVTTRGVITVDSGGSPLRDPSQIRSAFTGGIEDLLKQLADQSLLIA